MATPLYSVTNGFITRKQAEAVVTACADRILSFPETLGRVTSCDAVDRSCDSLIGHLRYQIEHNAELVEAQQALGFSGWHQDIINAFQEKIEAIRVAAERQRQNIANAHETITRCVKRIQAFSVSFETINSSQAIDKLYVAQVERLRVLVDCELAQAQKTLGFEGVWPQAIITAFESQRNELLSLAERRRASTQAADLVVANCVGQINAVPVLFQSLFSWQHIVKHRQSLFKKLHAIVDNNQHLIEAQRTLGLDGDRPQVVNDALLAKTDAIRKAVREQATKINKANAVINDCVHDIKSFAVSFDSLSTIQSVESRRIFLLRELDAMIQYNTQLTSALSDLDMQVFGHPRIVKAASECTVQIMDKAKAAKNRIECNIKEARAIINNTNFMERLLIINRHANDLEDKAKKDSNFIPLSVAARGLFTDLEKAKEQFVTSGKPKALNLDEFKTLCLSAIKKAQEILVDRVWRHTLATLKAFIETVANPGAVAGRRKLGFFGAQQVPRDEVDNAMRDGITATVGH